MAVNIRDRLSVAASLASHRRKFDHHESARKALPKGHPKRAYHWQRRETARWYINRRKAQLAKLTPSKPRIVDLHLDGPNLFGGIGPITGVIGHYTAGPRDRTDTEAARLWRQYHAQHKRQGWGKIGYHIGVSSAGTIFLLRDIGQKGAHTAGANSGKVGIVMHGTTGDRPTAAQQAAVKWLAANAHTAAMPASHRASRSLANVRWYGHNDFNATACPGSFKTVYTSKGKKR